MAEVIAPVVMNEIEISSISPSVAEYSASVIIPENPIFFADCAESGKSSNKASPASAVTKTSSINA